MELFFLAGIAVLTVGIFIQTSRLHEAKTSLTQAKLDAEEASYRMLASELHCNTQEQAVADYERVLAELEQRTGVRRSEIIVVPRRSSELVFDRS